MPASLNAGKVSTMQRNHIFIAAILLATMLAGCRDEEQGRPYIVDKGQYTGMVDSQLSAAQMSALNSRTVLQGSANVTGGVARRPAEERPSPVQSEALSQRLQEQSGN